jgi:nitrogen PTS system EIIA component
LPDLSHDFIQVDELDSRQTRFQPRPGFGSVVVSGIGAADGKVPKRGQRNMRLIDLLSPDAIIPSLKATTKKQAMMELSERASELSGLPTRAIFDSLLQRERLGSTGIGEGVAIPHGKLAKLKSIFGIFARLERPIDFDALDGEPVDLLFLLVTPESAGADHLKALACAARMLRDNGLVAAIRATRDPSALYSLIASESKPHAA